MHSYARAARRFGLLLPLLLLGTAPAAVIGPTAALAKDAPAAARSSVPWLYKGSDVPVDPEWTFGTLPSGLRYAVRHNGVPPGQVSIRIRIDAGSLNETDSEQGFAHLLEHLSFRESKYLKEGEAIPTWQRLGATFGSDTNAETTPTGTTYKLDLPNATPATLDETFKLLSGMITAPIFTAHGVKTEVPIVLAEMRERGGPAQRVAEATRALYFQGQPLANRTPIGKVETLEAATDASVRAFHDRWYRPENTVIVVAGDVDAAVLEAQVKKWFGDWRGVGKFVPTPSFGAPAAPKGSDPANPVGDAAVLVEPDLPRIVNYAILRPWHQVNDTIAYNRGLMLDQMAQALINRRLEARARAGGSFLSAQVNQEDVSRSADATFVSVTPLGEDWQAALRDTRAVIADALARPATQEEIDRELAEFDVAFAVPVETRDTLAGSKLADDIIRAVDIRETVASPETVLKVFRDMRAEFTPAAVLAHTRALFSGTVTRPVLVTPKASDATPASLRQALLAPVKADGSSRLAAKAISFKDLPPIGPAGTVTAAAPTGLLQIESVTLSNGVKALLWNNDAEPGRIMVKVRFGNGYGAIRPEDATYVSLGNAALVSSGLGTLGQEELDRISTGRKLGFNFAVDDDAFEFTADTRPADLEDQLYLFAAKLAMPRWDANPVVRAKAAARLQYESYVSSPQSVLQRDLDYLIHGQDPRYKTPTPAELEKTTPEGFRRVWEPILASGPIEVDLFGDFKREDAIAALEKTFGALKPRPAATSARFAPPFPAPVTRPVVLAHHGDSNQAAAMVAWPTGGGRAGIRESRQLEILAQLFNNRLFDRMREKLGASYAPQVQSDWPLDRETGGYIAAAGQLTPQAVPAFFSAADEIAADLVANPPTADELSRITEPLKQLISRAATGNGFWLYQLEGAAVQPSRLGEVRSILDDYSRTTPEAMQALAARYLVGQRSWRLEVLPEKLVTARAGIPGQPAASN
ncbi:M16 family metallopeptidase [Novosphingobium tardum]|uniref:M16 family metallopeptidase n=1 Tax=Novosphingobium tardum TaxID=1538021 RepID=A0ABV8RSH7_9SPHN